MWVIAESGDALNMERVEMLEVSKRQEEAASEGGQALLMDVPRFGAPQTFTVNAVLQSGRVVTLGQCRSRDEADGLRKHLILTSRENRPFVNVGDCLRQQREAGPGRESGGPAANGIDGELRVAGRRS